MDVEIWSDIACPWCYVGKRRLERALEEYEGDVTVIWRSFELDPTAPAEREGSISDHLARKYGRSPEQAAEMLDQMRATAAEDGLDLRADIQRSGNTFDGHRLIHLAAAHGRADAMKERLMRAYHSEGELIGDHATLQRLGAEVGLPADEIAELLAGDRFADAVRADEEQAVEFGVQGVPFFVADRKMAVAGAQPPEFLAELLRQAAAR